MIFGALAIMAVCVGITANLVGVRAIRAEATDERLGTIRILIFLDIALVIALTNLVAGAVR